MNPWVRLALTLVLAWLATELGWADDCSSPEDTMDTLWVGPPLKGIMSILIAAAVNGQTIMSQVLQRPGTQPGEQGEKPQPELRLEVNTQDRRTELTPGDDEGLWAYASIRSRNAPPTLVSAASASISFSGDAGLSLSGHQQAGSRKAVYVRAVQAEGESPPVTAVLTVHAVLAGQPVAAPVTFKLGGGYELEIQTSSQWSG